MVWPASQQAFPYESKGLNVWEDSYGSWESWVAEISDETLGGPEDISEDPRDPGSPSENGIHSGKLW